MSPLLNVAEAAKALGIAPTTLRDWVTARKVVFTKMGRLVKFSEDDLKEIVAAGRTPPVSAPRDPPARARKGRRPSPSRRPA